MISKRNNRIGFWAIFSFILLILASLLVVILIVHDGKDPKKAIEDKKAVNYIQLESEVKMATTYIDSLLSVLDKDNEDILVNEDLYMDIIIYGDETYTKANDLETKIYMLKNVIGQLNSRKDEVHAMKGRSRDAKDFLDYANKEIKKTNVLLYDYNKLNGTKMIDIPTLDDTITK